MPTKTDPRSSDYRMTVYLGTGAEAQALKKRIQDQISVDVRFRGSPMNFVRYAVYYALEHDPSLKRPAAA